MAAQPRFFGRAERALVRAGELSGEVPRVLNQIAEDLELQWRTGKRLFLSTLLFWFLTPLWFVIPSIGHVITYGVKAWASRSNCPCSARSGETSR